MKKTFAALAILVLYIVVAAGVAHGATKTTITKAETNAANLAKNVDRLLKFKSCGKNCEQANDNWDYISVIVRDGLIVLEFEPGNTIDSSGNLTEASYMQIDVEKRVVEYYCGTAGWNWLISPHGVFYKWGTSNVVNYTTWSTFNHHHLSFAADNDYGIYTLTVVL